MKKLLPDTTNFVFKFEGIRNKWKEENGFFGKPGKSASLFSAGLEIFYDKNFFYVEVHLWLFGFQIFELTAGKNP